jgi:predicted NBD/HSP70 family sugar kinase
MSAPASHMPGAAGTVQPATPSSARAINDRAALDFLLARGPLTAAQLKSLTGLSRPTTSDLLARLVASGLVEAAGESDAVQRGPNARLYQITATRAHVAGLDVSREGASLAVSDLSGSVAATTDLRAPDDGGSAVSTTVEALAGTLRQAKASPHVIAVGAPGRIDLAAGQIRPNPLLPRWHADLITALRERWRVPVIVENEVNLAAVAEHRQGAAQDRVTFVLLWLDQAVGAGVILDSRLLRGASGGTGEVGFLAVPGTSGLPSAQDCGYGFEGLTGSRAVCDLARRHGIRNAPANDPSAAAAAAAVRSAIAQGAPGTEFLDQLASNIALGAHNMCVVLDPGCLVLGGHVGRAGGRELASRVAARLTELSPLPTDVRSSQLTGNAVLTGAVLTALDAAHDDLFGPRAQRG